MICEIIYKTRNPAFHMQDENDYSRKIIEVEKEVIPPVECKKLNWESFRFYEKGCGTSKEFYNKTRVKKLWPISEFEKLTLTPELIENTYFIDFQKKIHQMTLNEAKNIIITAGCRGCDKLIELKSGEIILTHREIELL